MKLRSKRSAAARYSATAAALLTAVLCSLGFYHFGGMRPDPRVSSVADDLKALAAAFEIYRETHGSYPPNVDTGIAPEGMENVKELLEQPTPVGGRYDWEGPDVWGFAAISIQKIDTIIPQLLQLDAEIDDGKLYTGKFRFDRNAYYYMLQEKPQT